MIAENLANRYDHGVVITGGNPMLRTDLPALVSKLRTHRVQRIHLVTNGFANKDQADLRDLFDRISYTVHIRNGEHQPALSPIIQGLAELSRLNAPIEVNFLLCDYTKDIIKHLIPDIAKETAVRKFQLQRLIVRPEFSREKALSDHDVKRFMQDLKMIRTSLDLEISVNDFASKGAKYYVVRSNGSFFEHTTTSTNEIGSLLKPEQSVALPIIPQFSKYQFSVRANGKGPHTVEHMSGALSDADIRRALASGKISIARSDGISAEPTIGSASIDLTLSSFYWRWKAAPRFGSRVLDLASLEQEQLHALLKQGLAGPDKGIVIAPGEFILARTNERVQIPATILGLLTGRSSFSRLGVSISFTQSLIAPGHDAYIPLQICNNAPHSIILYPGTRISQLMFISLHQASQLPYSRNPKAKYVGLIEEAPVLSRWFKDEFPGTKSSHRSGQSIDWKNVLDSAMITIVVLAICSTGGAVVFNGQLAQSVKLALVIPTVGLLLLSAILRLVLFLRAHAK